MPVSPAESTKSPPEALKRFLKRVLREQKLVQESFAPEPIHDLRVALRRCRSLAEGLSTLDDSREWKRLQRCAKDLQDELADLRDVYVWKQHVRRLHLLQEPAGQTIEEALGQDDRKAHRRAKRAMKKFSRKAWKKWRRRLPKRTAELDLQPQVFAQLALRRLQEVGVREHRWQESGSESAAHRTRIAVKQFRYTVQSFLPAQYSAWEKNLRRIQDALGDLHDLDLLQDWLRKVAKRASLDHAAVQLWIKRIAEARRDCLERYRRGVTLKRKRGPADSSNVAVVWDRWREELEALESLNYPPGAKASE
jgi:CHAD domain-containing protein